MYDPPDSLVPLLNASASPGRGPIIGWLSSWNSSTYANTVQLDGQSYTNFPVLGSAVATLASSCSVLLLPFGATYMILGRVRVP